MHVAQEAPGRLLDAHAFAHFAGAGLQKLVRLADGRGLWLTYARYLTPAGDAIQGKGLTPDVEVDEPDVDFGEAPPEKDAILDTAIDRIHGRNAA